MTIIMSNSFFFLVQVDAFEALLKNGKLKPCEQIKVWWCLF